MAWIYQGDVEKWDSSRLKTTTHWGFPLCAVFEIISKLYKEAHNAVLKGKGHKEEKWEPYVTIYWLSEKIGQSFLI